MTEEVFHQVFDTFGAEKVYVLGRTSSVEVLVLFRSCHDATRALEALHGRCIYDNCCWLDIRHEMSLPTTITPVTPTKCSTSCPIQGANKTISVSGNLHGAGNSHGNSGSKSVYLSEDRDHIEKVESPSKRKPSGKIALVTIKIVSDASTHEGSSQQDKRDDKISALGPLKDNERKDLNGAVKEYLLLARYRLAAMTSIEEVPDHDLDVWTNSSACVPDALRRYYYQYLSSTTEAAEEKISILRENETLTKDNERLCAEKDSLMKSREVANSQVAALRKSLEAAHMDIKEKEKTVQDLKQSLDVQRKGLNDCRAEITALKMHIEGTRSSKQLSVGDTNDFASQSIANSMEEAAALCNERENLPRSESITAKLALAASLTEVLQKCYGPEAYVWSAGVIRYVISALIRDNVNGQEAFHSENGSAMLQHVLASNSIDVRLQKKAVFLVTDLADFQLNSGNSGLAFLSERLFLKLMVDMLSRFDLDLQEKVLLAIKSLLKLSSTDAMDFEFCGLNNVLYRLGVQLDELTSEEQKEFAGEVDSLRREVQMLFQQKLKEGTTTAT